MFWSVVGNVLGAVLAVDAVDSIVGSPIKKVLGLAPEQQSGVQITKFTKADIAMAKTQGFQNYVESLLATAPLYTARTFTAKRASFERKEDAKYSDMQLNLKYFKAGNTGTKAKLSSETFDVPQLDVKRQLLY